MNISVFRCKIFSSQSFKQFHAKTTTKAIDRLDQKEKLYFLPFASSTLRFYSVIYQIIISVKDVRAHMSPLIKRKYKSRIKAEILIRNIIIVLKFELWNIKINKTQNEFSSLPHTLQSEATALLHKWFVWDFQREAWVHKRRWLRPVLNECFPMKITRARDPPRVSQGSSLAHNKFSIFITSWVV